MPIFPARFAMALLPRIFGKRAISRRTEVDSDAASASRGMGHVAYNDFATAMLKVVATSIL